MLRMTEREALMALNAVYGLGPIRIKKLMGRWRSAVEICSLSERTLVQESGLPANVVQTLTHFRFQDFLDQERQLIERHRVMVMTFDDPGYPPLLKEIPDPPVVLYVKGTGPIGDQPAVAVVGSRRASVYGMGVAHQLSCRLGELGIVIVSGLARGIDKAAHSGCLRSGGRTLAVLGNGLQSVFPMQNRALAAQVEKQGALISEFPMTTYPLAQNYPRRNRIVSGLSLGTIVVEAAERSGALITSRYALEQDREVFAVPGPVGHPNTKGTHALIRQGAKLVASVEDILCELNVPLRAAISHQPEIQSGTMVKQTASPLTKQENRLLEYLNDQPADIETCVDRTGWDISTLNAILLQLEVKKQVKQIPGKKFVRAAIH